MQMTLSTRTLLLAALLALLLGACGFHLRGQTAYALPFKTLTLRSANDFSPLMLELKQAVQKQGVQIVDAPHLTQTDPPQLILHIASENTGKHILSLSGTGRVQEFQLNYRVLLRLYDTQQQDWIAPVEINLQRNLPYDDTQVLAKEAEEAMLYKEMRHDAAQQILRRLNRARASEILPSSEISPAPAQPTPPAKP